MTASDGLRDRLIEAAARADYEHTVSPSGINAPGWDDLTDDHRRSYRLHQARVLDAVLPLLTDELVRQRELATGWHGQARDWYHHGWTDAIATLNRMPPNPAGVL